LPIILNQLCTDLDFSVFSPQKIIGGLWVRQCKLHFPPYRLVKFHENPFSCSRERLSGIFVADGKKTKKQKTKKSVKHIRAT